MKYRILGIITLFIAGGFGTLQAQRPYYQPQVHEIGVNLLTGHQVPDLSSYYENMPLSLNYANGIRYKYHLTYADALRAQVDYATSSFDIPEGIERFESYAADQSEWLLKLGYERKHHVGSLQLYAGIDARLGMGNFQSVGKLQGTAMNEVENDLNYTSYGGSATAGVRVFMSPYLSAGIEASAYYAWLNYTEANESVFYLQPDTQWGWNSQVYVSFHFKKMKKRCSCPKF